jgi:predicted PurR-regulated permease PerM
MSESTSFKQEAADNNSSTALLASPDKVLLFRIFFFGVFVFLIYQLLLILSVFADVIIWAASLSLVFTPAHSWLLQRMPLRPNSAALLSTLGVFLLVLIPIMWVFWVVIVQSAQLYPTVSEWVTEVSAQNEDGWINMLPEPLRTWWRDIDIYLAQSTLFSQFNPRQFMLDNVDAMSLMLANFGATAARNLLIGFVNLMLILVSMFFCFRDGRRFLRWFFAVLPMPDDQSQQVALRVYQTITAVIRGALLTALVQGGIAMVGYMIAGVPLAILFGVLTGLAGMIPVVGAALIWLPLGLFTMAESQGWGLFVLVWGFVAVSLSDNIIKPLIIGSRARMPILLIFCGIIGGASVYGFTGLIIGPILIAVLLAFVSIYREHYQPATVKPLIVPIQNVPATPQGPITR